MGYDKPIKFSKTNRYGRGPKDEDDVYTIEEFRQNVQNGSFIDYDGFGYPVKNGKADESIFVKPSELDQIPTDATHIVWYNK